MDADTGQKYWCVHDFHKFHTKASLKGEYLKKIHTSSCHDEGSIFPGKMSKTKSCNHILCVNDIC